ncbi:MAG TPA: ribonuclease HIII [Chlamydiales bacterium]|nr:MAG: ribonuclease HIII [Verrucomicrobia bacterium RIFCSPHIGHO2_12_FULL_41_10]HLB52998.1 ribonuclease HIII [Chlamydiales bacterium]
MTQKSNSFTAEVSLDIAKKLEHDLIEQGFEISHPPYTIFSAKKKGVSCSLYQSGKLLVQGKEMSQFIEFYLEPEILGQFHFSHPEAHLDVKPRIGMDEAGKGDFFGPLCVAALFANEEGIKFLRKLGVKDSKKMKDDQIRKIASEIKTHFQHTIVRLFPKTYNSLYVKFKNLNRLLAWAHTTALGELSHKTGCKDAILDQFAYPELMEKMLKEKKLEVALLQRTKGESDLVVAGASILARAAFVEGIELLEKEWECVLPKGASRLVVEAGKKLFRQFDSEFFTQVAKTHFKTMEEIANN